MKKSLILIFAVVFACLFAITIIQNNTIFISHRGINGSDSENNTNAFNNAVESGYDHIECDLMVIDGEIYITHDYQETSELNTIGDLTRFMDANTDITVYPELKGEWSTNDLLYLDSYLRNHKDNLVIQVRDVETMKSISDEGYETLLIQTDEYTVEEYINICNKDDCYVGFNYYELTTNDLIYIDEHFKRDIYWTVDSSSDINKLMQYDPYGIMTDLNYEQIKDYD